MNRRRYHDADDFIPPAEPMPLFEQPAAWPERSPATDEQIVGAIGGTIQADYEAWRKTEAGERAMTAFLREALGRFVRGADKPGSLRAKSIWEHVRDELRVPLNNSFTPLIAREAEQLAPVLAGLFEKRQRTAS